MEQELEYSASSVLYHTDVSAVDPLYDKIQCAQPYIHIESYRGSITSQAFTVSLPISAAC